MARPLRIDYPGAWHHVMNRGRRRESVFHDAKDFQKFIDVLLNTSEMFRAGITAYCLMSNHYHLLIHTPEGNLTRCMRHLGGVYTQYFNRQYGHDGPLFRGRYKAILVEEETYLLGLVRYIHHNPLKAGLVKKLKDYPWSSHPGYLSENKAWDWLHKEPVLSQFADTSAKARAAYRQYMAQDDEEEIERIFSLKKLPAVLGSGEFIQKIKDRFFAAKNNPEVPESKFLAPSVETILREVSNHWNVQQKELLISSRGNTNEARDIAVYLVRTLRGDPLTSIARLFNCNRSSTVGSTLYRVKNQLAEDPRLRKKVNDLKEKVLKGQSKV